MEQKRVFRTELFGFNRMDVNSFISELGKKVDAVHAEKEDADVQAQNLRQELEMAMTSMDSLSAQNAKLLEELKQVQESCEQLRTASRIQMENRVKLGREAAQLKNTLSELEKELPELREKSKKYENSSMHIADAMISAREEADRIIDDALATAAKIRAQLKQETTMINESVEKLMSDYSVAKNDTYRYAEYIKTMLEAIFVELDGARLRICDTMNQVDEIPFDKECFYSKKDSD